MTFPLSVLMKKKTLKIIMKKFLLIIFFHLLLFQHNILHKCCLQFNKITKFGDLFVFHKILQFNYDATGELSMTRIHSFYFPMILLFL